MTLLRILGPQFRFSAPEDGYHDEGLSWLFLDPDNCWGAALK
jgi:hypothetical protein